jgi:erythronate-4-phosphate dehydrogenase
MLRILADENIALVREAFSVLGEVRLVPGRAITPALVRDADVLLVRSVTRVDGALIAGSRLRFVGSATIGTDHVDAAALAAAGIPFHYAPGSNAESVVEYVLAALLAVAAGTDEPLRGRRVGIVGCGHIGGRLAARLPALGMDVLRNDPPLAEAAERAGRRHEYVTLERVLEECDVITLHVPLTSGTRHPTHHLIDAAALARLRPGTWLVNTSRGAVVHGRALLDAFERGAPGAAILDVWEHEPVPDPRLIARCALATPHIAGYSWDGKVAGTRMLYDALVNELGLESAWPGATVDSAPGALARPDLAPPDGPLGETRWLHALVRQLYDVAGDDARMRTLLDLPAAARADAFHELRRRYPRRRAFAACTLDAAAVPDALRAAVSSGLGIPLS